MRKAITSLMVIVFAGLLFTSLVSVFSGSKLGSQYANSQSMRYPYFMAY